ncbi:MAG: TVP38/TMEM64 family protein [Candidatus Omnitrophica bacterium]|nr:TVP38/TMEM64 family protein [Candidatus Omnitrophota bacterium]
MNQKVKFLIFICVIVIAAFLVKATPFAHYFSKEHIITFLQAIRGEWWGPVVFIMIYGIGCVFALPGSVLTLAGGAVFGIWRGTLYNAIAANFGASLAFFVARFMGRDFVKGFMKSGKMAKFDEQIGKSGFKTIFRLRLIPIVPFNGLNFGSGLSSIRFRDYLFASLLGMLPGTFIYTYFADALVKGVQGASQKAFLNLTAACALLIFISFLPSIYQKVKGNRNEKI